MEVILQKNVKNLGNKQDLVRVKDGYGRNYLIPKGLAVLATESTKKVWQENSKQQAHKCAKDLQEAQKLSQTLVSVELEIPTKASDKGSIYGAITSFQVSKALKTKQYFVPRENISFKDPIKTIGKHQATLHLHKDVQVDITLQIVAE